MTLPISSSNSSNPPLQVLHNVDRRMEMIINQALASESCEILSNVVFRKKITPSSLINNYAAFS